MQEGQAATTERTPLVPGSSTRSIGSHGEIIPFGVEPGVPHTINGYLDEDFDEEVPPTKHHGEHGIADNMLRGVRTIPLAVIIFYVVSGGPFGAEPSVRAGGFLYTLIGYIVLPFIWCLPEALITTELGLMYPEASGAVAWVEEAFGTTTGLLAGYMKWVSGATDNAIYPVLFLEYLLNVMYPSNGDGTPDDDATSAYELNGVVRFVLLASASAMLAYVNYLGLDIIGHMSILICVISMSPFIIMCVMGFSKIDPSRLWQTPTTADLTFDDDTIAGAGWLPVASLGGVLWRPFLNNLFWNLNSFDSAGSFVAEVRNPVKTFPRAMNIAVALVGICYFFPILVAIGATNSRQDQWEEGYFATLASDIGGPWLGALTVLAAGISNLALFQAEMSSDAYQIMGMADRGLLPKIFRTRSPYGTPTYGIVLGTAVIIVMSISDFGSLVEMLNFNYAIALLIEYAAFVKLRISKSEEHRPYRIPLSTPACIVALIPTCGLILVVLALASYKTYLYCIGALFIGVLMKVLSRCHFEPEHAEYHDITDIDHFIEELEHRQSIMRTECTDGTSSSNSDGTEVETSSFGISRN